MKSLTILLTLCVLFLTMGCDPVKTQPEAINAPTDGGVPDQEPKKGGSSLAELDVDGVADH